MPSSSYFLPPFLADGRNHCGGRGDGHIAKKGENTAYNLLSLLSLFQEAIYGLFCVVAPHLSRVPEEQDVDAERAFDRHLLSKARE